MASKQRRWRLVGSITYRKDARANVETLLGHKTTSAVWKLVYNFRNERIVYIGSTTNVLGRVTESVGGAKDGCYDEHLRSHLSQEVGSVELFLCCEGMEQTVRDGTKRAAIHEEQAAGAQLLSKEGDHTEPEWLTAFRLRSKAIAARCELERKLVNKVSEKKRLEALKALRKSEDKLAAFSTAYDYRFRIWDGDVPPFLDAIDDLQTEAPKQRDVSGSRYVRDPAVRAAVRLRANGQCEYCGKPGFLCADGTPYIECHHIIALADAGADHVSNVIALCSEHHREAHFGKHAPSLEQEMIARLHAILHGE